MVDATVSRAVRALDVRWLLAPDGAQSVGTPEQVLLVVCGAEDVIPNEAQQKDSQGVGVRKLDWVVYQVQTLERQNTHWGIRTTHDRCFILKHNYYCVGVCLCVLPAVCRGRATTHSPPNPDTIQSGHGRYQWSSGTMPRSRRNPKHKLPKRKQTRKQFSSYYYASLGSVQKDLTFSEVKVRYR